MESSHAGSGTAVIWFTPRVIAPPVSFVFWIQSRVAVSG